MPRSAAVEGRIVRAAEAALAHHQYVSAIDILTGAGLLAPTHVERWLCVTQLNMRLGVGSERIRKYAFPGALSNAPFQ